MLAGLILPFGLLMQLCFNKLQSQAPLQLSLSSLYVPIALIPTLNQFIPLF